jgi:hypothetical protein
MPCARKRSRTPSAHAAGTSPRPLPVIHQAR